MAWTVRTSTATSGNAGRMVTDGTDASLAFALDPSAPSASVSASPSLSPSPASYVDKYATVGNSYTNKYTSVGSRNVD